MRMGGQTVVAVLGDAMVPFTGFIRRIDVDRHLGEEG